MKLIVPNYYKQFRCTADQCKDSCCIGWEIDIDQDTYEYYTKVQGSLGEKLKAQMVVSDDMHCFQLTSQQRCPFLNHKNLCEIVLGLGEEALGEICTEYPRFVIEYGDIREKSLALSCEEVGRLIFENQDKTQFLLCAGRECRQPNGEKEAEETEPEGSAVEQIYDWHIKEYPKVCLEEDESEEMAFEASQIILLQQIQTTTIGILEEREIPVLKRQQLYLDFLKKIQEYFNQCQWNEARQLITRYQGKALFERYGEMDWNALAEARNQNAWERIKERCEILKGMELLDEEWEKQQQKLEDYICSGNGQQYLAQMQQLYSLEPEKREIEYEKLMVYFTFRYFMKAVYDGNIYSKGVLSIFCCEVMDDLKMIRFLDQKNCFSTEDQIDLTRIFSKEVEHSEDNLEYLEEEVLFGETGI